MEKSPATNTVESQQLSSSRLPSPGKRLLKRRTPEEHAQWERDRNTWVRAVEIGAVYTEATGQPIGINQLYALHVNGYAPDPEDIIRIFYSLDDFNSFAEEEYIASLEKRKEKKEELLQLIEVDIIHRSIDPRLFLASEGYVSDEQKIKAIAGRKVKNYKVRLTDTQVDEDEKIRRYLLYKIVEELTANLDNTVEQQKSVNGLPPAERRLNIVLGFNVETGSKISSLHAELSKSNSLLTVEKAREAVDLISDDRGWDQYIDRDSRRRWLNEVVSASQEYRFDKTGAAIPIGNIAIKGAKIIPSDDEQSPTIVDLIAGEEIDIKMTRKNISANWSKDDYLEYGKWLVSILSPRDVELSSIMIQNASRLGLGPGVDAIIKVFGSVKEFYRELGIVKDADEKDFENWTVDDSIAYVRAVASRHEGKITHRILKAEYQQARKNGVLVPSVHQLRKSANGDLKDLFEMAGVYSQPFEMSHETCINQVIDFIQREKRLPRKEDYIKSRDLPSTATAHRYFGGYKNLTNKAVEALQNEASATEIAA